MRPKSQERIGPIHFEPSDPFTIGIEVELQLIDPGSLELAPMAPVMLSNLPDRLQGHVKQEFISSMLEVNTPACPDFATAERELARIIQEFLTHARVSGCLVMAAGLHPFSKSAVQELFPDQRYRQIMEELQEVGRRLITQGLHCHIGLPDPETTIMVFDRIRGLLPLFLALSASSPFFEGRDTGLCSYRSNLFDALPRSGMPDALGSWQAFEELMELLLRCGIVSSPRDIWWDVRPSPHFGTIEVRICDTPTTFPAMMALAALIQAVVSALAMGRLQVPSMPRAVIQANKWQAARYGLEGWFIRPDGSRKKMSEVLETLLDRLADRFEALGSMAYLDVLSSMAVNSEESRSGCRIPGYRRMRELSRHQGGLALMVKALVEEFQASLPQNHDPVD